MRDDPAAPPARSRPYVISPRVLLVAAASLAVSLGVLGIVFAVPALSGGTREVLIGGWDDVAITVASAVAATVSMLVLVLAVRAPRWWLALFVPLRLGATVAVLGALFAALLTAGGTVTPLVAEGCRTGYVVAERAFLFSASVRVLRPEGLVAEEVASLSTNDGHTPFRRGSYIAIADAQTVTVWHTFDNDRERLTTDGEPNAVLPRIVDAATAVCGVPGGGEPDAAPATPSDPSATMTGEGPAQRPAGDTRAEVLAMATTALDTAVGPATDSAGSPLAVPSATDLPCDGTTGLDLSFATADNAASYAAILAVFDAAGYAADRAMQEDLRFNGVVRLSARDRSSIDGLLHLSLTAECVPG
ncbi:hypothetical protein [Microbacterium sp. HMWF026]|uniref:hypothetical protein n=1 Tax=Microbacterium sp. HMWF026 TaxID=2056861 RepID=UPI0011B272A6|nr:hypothetical protein [Microbacterium sp. HMWF026]